MVVVPGYQIKFLIYKDKDKNYEMYRGVRKEDEQPVILKRIIIEDSHSELSNQYQHEFALLQSLRGEGIIKALDLFTVDDETIIIYEDIGALFLKNLILEKTFSIGEALSIAIKITAALERIHRAGFIHKRINPANIFYQTGLKQIQLINFELSTELIADQMYSDGSELNQQTVAYIAPEQTGKMNRFLDYRSDLYSLGATFYELFSGKPVFRTNDMLEFIHSHIAIIPKSPDTVNPQIPKPLSSIILKLLSKEAEDRYLSAVGLKHDLNVCLDQYIRTGKIKPFALQKQDISDKVKLSGKLYGRKEEIEILKTAFERVTKGDLELVLVTGYAGIGKTALVREAIQNMTYFSEDKTVHVGVGKFDPIHKDIPYSAIAAALKDVIRQILAKNNTEIKIWRKRCSKALGRNGRVIVDIIPEIEVILGPQKAVPKLGPIEARNRLNLVFQNLVRALCGPGYPLIIFLDDVQHADIASLKLIETILSDDGLYYFLGVGAFRDDEAGSEHPIYDTLDVLKNKNVRLTWLRLASLGLKSVRSLIADSISMHPDKSQVRELSALTLQKTDGNPFFIEMFLKTLHSEKLLEFDAEQSRWKWSIAEINKLEITDNVVDLLVQKIQSLSDNTQELLGWASCIGIEFDLSEFLSMCGKLYGEMDAFLLEAVTSGVIVPVAPIYQHNKKGPNKKSNLIIGRYRFAHDRIRQAVYSAMKTEKKQFCHSRIGLNLLNKLSEKEKVDQLFTIVNHLNVADKSKMSEDQKKEVSQLNFEAGIKAKSAAAFYPAFNYLQNGIRMLERNSWEDNYDLTKKLFEKTAETSYLSGNFEETDRIVGVVIERAHSLLDTINIYEISINSYIARYQLEHAISIAIDILRKLNVRLPEKASKWRLFRGLLGAKTTLTGRKISDFEFLSKMEDPKYLAAMRILKCAGPPAYFSNQELMALMTFKAVQLSVRHGNSPESITWYSAYGLILCSVIGEINTGFQFGQLALKMLASSKNLGIVSMTSHMAYAFVLHWKIHIRETLSPLKSAHKIGLETGDFEYSGYCALFYCYHSFVSGMELPEVEQRMKKYSAVIKRLKHELTFHLNQLFRQVLYNLSNGTEKFYQLSGPFYDEKELFPVHQEAKDRTTLSNAYIAKTILCYIFGNYNKAIKYSTIAENYLDGITGSIGIPLFYFYDSLSHIAIYNDVGEIDKGKITKKVINNQKKMKQWAKHAPMNYKHKYLLVEAERHILLGQYKISEKYFGQAAKLASKYGYRNEEALIYEREAVFYANRGENQLAAETMLKARSAYQKWGALAKVNALDKEFTFLLVERQAEVNNKKESSGDLKFKKPVEFKKDLDMAAVMKATQAISREIVLEKLLDQLMRIIIENAGAQKGLLILKKKEGMLVKASVEADSDVVNENQSLPVEECDALSLDIVRYVERTGEPIVINKATEDNQFYTDLHILEHRPKSILCMPILLKEKITGLLYLENSLASNVFTKERVKVLNILLAQAAISLENAQLYANLKKEVSVRKNAEERLLHLATALEQAAEGILITEIDGTITYANPACEEIFGYDQNEIRGKNTRILRSGLQGEEFFNNIWHNLRSGKIWSGRMSSKKKDESICELEVTISPIRDERGKISNYVSVSRDVTHEIQMEKELRQAQKMEAMGTLAGGIAHDFNNILAAIMGYTELATYQSPPESPIHQNLERVITSTRRAKDLVRQILAFSRQTDQEARPVQLKIIIKEALKMLRASLPSTIEMQQNIDNNSGFVEADPTQIHQVVMNLCTNAAQAMERGGTLTVNLDDYEIDHSNHHLYPEVIPGKFLRLVVKDSGEGIEQSIIERIFEPFFTTKEPGKGTGMGLAMVHGIIKRCEGVIRVKSQLAKGTTFQVLFPRYHGALSEEEEVSNGDFIPGKERIMFVDDEKALVTLVEEGLQRIGYQVHLETDSNKALDAFKQSPQNFDLVITDQTMPKLTGMELSREIIQIRPDIPIILYSGLMDEITAEMIESVGIRSFLSKPLMLKQLSEEIRQVLDAPGRETMD